jgi:hypothetical protein
MEVASTNEIRRLPALRLDEQVRRAFCTIDKEHKQLEAITATHEALEM